MLTYTYKCSECNHTFEIKQRITDDSLEVCPECNHAALKRVITANPFILKGDGWESYQKSGRYHQK